MLATGGVSAAAGRTGATLTLNAPPLAASAGSAIWPQLGDTITFTSSYPKQLDHYGVRVQVVCYQAGVLVWAQSTTAAGAATNGFKLGGDSSPWKDTGGGADCNADLYYWSYGGTMQFNWLASTTFAVPQ
jgi:hypothetical protein